MKYIIKFFLIVTSLFLFSCSTNDNTLRDQGRSDSYIQGYHDGRHSGMKEEGNNYEHYIKDKSRFVNDLEYKSGWLAGEVEGKELEGQAESIGNAVAGAYSASKISDEVDKNTDFDKAAKDAVQGIDTTGMDQLEK